MDEITQHIKRLLPLLAAIEEVLIRIISVVGRLMILLKVIGII